MKDSFLWSMACASWCIRTAISVRISRRSYNACGICSIGKACEVPLRCLDHFARPGGTISSARAYISDSFDIGAPIRHHRIFGPPLRTDSHCRPLIGQKPGVSTSSPRSFERPALLLSTGSPANQRQHLPTTRSLGHRKTMLPSLTPESSAARKLSRARV
jgi:hypothetical protein